MGGLESALAETEPILRSSDGIFQFTHPSFQEILTARQFADEINSGRLSVKDAYEQFWSYEEDAELWDLPKDREWRALLPAWLNVLPFMAPKLVSSRIIELVDVLIQKYVGFRLQFFDLNRPYNPFYDDFYLATMKVMPLADDKTYTEMVIDVCDKMNDALPEHSRRTLQFHIRSTGPCLMEDYLQLYTINDFGRKFYTRAPIDPYRDSDYSMNKDWQIIEPSLFVRRSKEEIESIVQSVRSKKDVCSTVIKDSYKWGTYEWPIFSRLVKGLMNGGEEAKILSLFECVKREIIKPEFYFGAIKEYPKKDTVRLLKRLIEGNIDKYVWYGFQAIYSIHTCLKPKGYNPPVKRLAA